MPDLASYVVGIQILCIYGYEQDHAEFISSDLEKAGHAASMSNISAPAPTSCNLVGGDLPIDR